MSEPRVLEGKAFLDKDFEAVKLPAWWMSGNCRAFSHVDPDVRAFRKAVPIYCGDFDLLVSCLKRKDSRDVSFERFIASHLRQRLHMRGGEVPEDAPRRFHFREAHHAEELARMPDAEQASSYVASLPQRAPVDALWECSNFGCLLWDWQQKSLERLGRVPGLGRGVYAPAVDGSEFLPRIFADAVPGLTDADTDEIREDALAGLEAMPELRGGLPRTEMARLITEDVHALAQLCRKHGTLGAAVLPGAFDPITGLCLKAMTGNEREVFLETDEHFYFVSVFTS